MGLAGRASGQRDRDGADAHYGSSVQHAGAYRDRGLGRGGRPGARRDGELRGRPSDDRRGTRDLPGRDAHLQGDRNRGLRAQRNPARCDSPRARQRPHASSMGPALRRQRAQPYRSSLRPSRTCGRRGSARHRGARGARRARHAAALGAGVRRRAGGKAQGARMRQGGDGQRTLLCDGSRQAMGARGACLARDRARRGNRRKQRARGGRTLLRCQ